MPKCNLLIAVRDMENEKKKPFYKSIWLRITAVILVLTLILSIVVNAFTMVTLKKVDAADDEAIEYLQENNDYMDLNAIRRASAKLRSLISDSYEATYQKFQVAIAEERYEDALALSDECIEKKDGIDAEYISILISKGCIEVLLKDPEAALHTFDRVLVLEPENTNVLLLEAQIFSEKDDYENLERVLQKYISVDPDRLSVIEILATLYLAKADYENASVYFDKWFSEATEEEESYTDNCFRYGIVLLARDHMEDAKVYLEKHLSLGGEEAGSLYYLGTVFLSLEDYENAVSNFSKSIEKNEFIQLSHFARAVCYIAVEDEQELELALADLYEVISYDGEDSDAEIVTEAKSISEEIQEVISGGADANN